MNFLLLKKVVECRSKFWNSSAEAYLRNTVYSNITGHIIFDAFYFHKKCHAEIIEIEHEREREREGDDGKRLYKACRGSIGINEHVVISIMNASGQLAALTMTAILKRLLSTD